MKTFRQFIKETLKEGMTTQDPGNVPGFSTLSDDRGPVAGRSPKMFFLSRKFAKIYSDGKKELEKIWLDNFKNR